MEAVTRRRPARAWRRLALAASLLGCTAPPRAGLAPGPASALPGAEQVSVEDVLERVREAVGYRASRALEQGVWERGTCSIEGLEGSYSLLFEPGGSFLQEIRTELPETTGFDGTTCWARDATGMPRVLALGGRTATLARMDVLTNAWLAPGSEAFAIAVDDEASDGEAIALTLQRGAWRATLFVARDSMVPRRLVSERAGGERTFELEDWQETLGFRLPHHLTVEGIAGDVSVFEIERVTPAPAFVRNPYELAGGPPEDTTFDASEPASFEAGRARTGHLLVRPTVDDRDVGWFLLDSGAGALCLDRRVADGLGLERFGKVSVVGAGGAVTGAYRSASTVALGPMAFRGVPWLELRMGALEPLLGVDDLAGILGFDLFMRAVVVVDAEANRVELHAPGDYELPSGEWQELRLDDRTPCVEASFEGDHTGWFRIDTGSDDTVIFHGPAVERLDLLADRDVERARTGGVGGFGQSHRGDLRWFELGGHRLEDLRVTFHDGAVGALRNAHTEGLIGLGLLRRFVLVLDCAGGRVAFLERDA